MAVRTICMSMSRKHDTMRISKSKLVIKFWMHLEALLFLLLNFELIEHAQMSSAASKLSYEMHFYTYLQFTVNVTET